MQTEFRPFENLQSDLNDVSELMCQPNTSIGIMLVDASGSMLEHGQKPARSVDLAVDALRADGARNYYLGICSFADRLKVLQQVMPIARVAPVSGYAAHGNTRLFGSVLEVMGFLFTQATKAGDRIAPDLSIAVGVFSDGADTSSPTAKAPLQKLAKMVRDRGWNLQCFGFGIDSKWLAGLLGFDPDFAITVAASAEGMESATTTFANTMTSGIMSRAPIPPTRTDGGIRTDP